MNAQTVGTEVGELVSVVYSSAATVPFTEVDLASLLLHSRMKNTAVGLTGVLLHRDGQFMQLLEGPRAAVRATLAVIAGDLRHTAMWTLDEEPVEARRFGSWSMGYREVATDDGTAPMWFGSPGASEPGAGASRAGELLTWFRDH